MTKPLSLPKLLDIASHEISEAYLPYEKLQETKIVKQKIFNITQSNYYISVPQLHKAIHKIVVGMKDWVDSVEVGEVKHRHVNAKSSMPSRIEVTKEIPAISAVITEVYKPRNKIFTVEGAWSNAFEKITGEIDGEYKKQILSFYDPNTRKLDLKKVGAYYTASYSKFYLLAALYFAVTRIRSEYTKPEPILSNWRALALLKKYTLNYYLNYSLWSITAHPDAGFVFPMRPKHIHTMSYSKKQNVETVSHEYGILQMAAGGWSTITSFLTFHDGINDETTPEITPGDPYSKVYVNSPLIGSSELASDIRVLYINDTHTRFDTAQVSFIGTPAGTPAKYQNNAGSFSKNKWEEMLNLINQGFFKIDKEFGVFKY